MSIIPQIRSFYENEQCLLDALAPEVEWHESEGFPNGGLYKGPEAVAQGVFSHLPGDWDDFRAVPEAVYAVGEDKALSLGRYRGVSRRTGKRLDAAFAHLYTIRDGKIVEFRQFADSARFRAALGA